jgi:adenosylcobinamide kinase/adenosylcobinamide-phosphate guanylyltransferase
MSSYPRKLFLATAIATDAEMKNRIAGHQKERGSDYVTIEEPVYLAKAIRDHASTRDGVLIDCLTFWLNNLFYYFGGNLSSKSEIVSNEIQDFLRVIEERPTSFVLVTNEINMGVIPADPLSRRFVDQQGWLNQEVARRSDEVILMVAGVPMSLRAPQGRSTGSANASSPATDSMAGSSHRLRQCHGWQ